MKTHGGAFLTKDRKSAETRPARLKKAMADTADTPAPAKKIPAKKESGTPPPPAEDHEQHDHAEHQDEEPQSEKTIAVRAF